MLEKNDRLLVVVCHPDDEILGCGGLLLKAKSLNINTCLLVLGEGDSSRYKNIKSQKYLSIKNKRHSSLLQIIKKLNISEYVIEQRLCNRFDTYPLLEIVKVIEDLINKFKPNILLTHDYCETNIDHKICYDAVESACRPLKNNPVKKIYSFEIPCSSSFTFRKKFIPNTYLDISNSIEKKIKLFSIYENELRKSPHPRSIESLYAFAKNRGMQSGLNYAEAYRLIRNII